MEYFKEVMAHIDGKHPLFLDAIYVSEKIDLLQSWENRMVFLAILAVARMVSWITCLKKVYKGTSVPCRDLIVYFKHLLKMKIRCYWKRLP